MRQFIEQMRNEFGKDLSMLDFEALAGEKKVIKEIQYEFNKNQFQSILIKDPEVLKPFSPNVTGSDIDQLKELLKPENAYADLKQKLQRPISVQTI